MPAGDMPVALMFDGPSLGGFVCPCTITSTELWKMGQVSPNDAVLFKPVTLGRDPCFTFLNLLRELNAFERDLSFVLLLQKRGCVCANAHPDTQA